MTGAGDKKAEKNLWKSILSDVAKRDENHDSYLLLLGDRGCGKRSLVKEINSKFVLGKNKYIPVEQMGSDFAALDFSFLYVKNLAERENAKSSVTTEDNLSKLSVWSLQDSDKGELIEAVLRPDCLQHTTACIVLDLDTPWELMN